MKNFATTFFILGVSYTLAFSQGQVKDSVIRRIIYHDTIIYRYDTVRIKHFVHSDTVWANPSATSHRTISGKERRH